MHQLKYIKNSLKNKNKYDMAILMKSIYNINANAHTYIQ